MELCLFSSLFKKYVFQRRCVIKTTISIKMLTPAFEIHQHQDFVSIVIRAPFASVSDIISIVYKTMCIAGSVRHTLV